MDKTAALASDILRGIGGEENIQRLENCMTRVRVEVHNDDQLDVPGLKKLSGVSGYVKQGQQHQLIVGPGKAAQVVDAMRASKVVRGPLTDGHEVDMGSPFDLFDARSHTDNPDLSPDVRHNRRWLRALLGQNGFRNLPEEWWHYTLDPEPHPDRYFDFAVR